MPAWRHDLPDYPAESHFVDVRGCALHYVDEGQGEPLLMVHGNPTWSYFYRRIIDSFSPAYRTIGIDHVGCGFSERPKAYDYSLERRIEDLMKFVEKLDLNGITLLVHDWGGAIGLGAALRDLTRYSRFVIFNTAAFPPPYFPWRIRICRTPILGRVAVQGCNLFARMATTMATTQREGLPKPIRAGFLAPYDSWKNRRAIFEFVKDIPTRKSQAAWQLLEEIENELCHLKGFPTKIIWGMRDWCFRPECLKKLQNLIPHAEVCELFDAGHYVIEDDPNRVINELQSFLSSEKPVDEPVI